MSASPPLPFVLAAAAVLALAPRAAHAGPKTEAAAEEAAEVADGPKAEDDAAEARGADAKAASPGGKAGADGTAPVQAAAPAPVAQAAAVRPDAEPPTQPLYPLWEWTGRVLGHRRLHLSNTVAGFGIGGRYEVGTRPLEFLFRMPNVHVRALLLERGAVSVAAQAELDVFLPGASEAFVSSNFVSRLDNAHVTVTTLPLSVSGSWTATPWLHVHGTATVMPILNSGAYRNRAVPGVTLAAELFALQRHSLTAHTGHVGLWDRDFALLGVSYRYRRSWFEARAGYFYRFLRDGTQTSPLVSLGANL